MSVVQVGYDKASQFNLSDKLCWEQTPDDRVAKENYLANWI